MELRKKGVLRSLQDLQTFWEHMLSQENDTESLVAVDSGVLYVCLCVFRVRYTIYGVCVCVRACVRVCVCVCVCVCPQLLVSRLPKYTIHVAQLRRAPVRSPRIWLPYAWFSSAAASRAHICQRHVAESPVLEEDEEDSSHSWAITALPWADKPTATSNQVSVALIKVCLLQSLYLNHIRMRHPPCLPPHIRHSTVVAIVTWLS